MDTEARGTGMGICQKKKRHTPRFAGVNTQDPCHPFPALAPRPGLFSRSRPGLARSLPVMTKLILVMAAASGGAVRGQAAKVNGTWGGRPSTRHHSGSAGFRRVGEVTRDAAESGPTGGGLDHNKAPVGHVNMLTARVQTHLLQALIRNLPYW